MLKSKMICDKKSACVYKNFEMKKVCSLEQKMFVCYLFITLIKEKLHYSTSIYSISCWVLLWYLVICYLCTHIAEFWKGIGTVQIKY